MTCPSCGSATALEEWVVQDSDGNDVTRFRIGCTNGECQLQGPLGMDEDEARRKFEALKA